MQKVANFNTGGCNSNMACSSNDNNPNSSRDMKNMEKKIEIRKMQLLKNEGAKGKYNQCQSASLNQNSRMKKKLQG